VTFPFFFTAHLFGSVKWSNRLGYKHNYKKKSITIWLHAASVGEVNVVGLLINHFRKIDSNILFYITVTTETGYKKASDEFGEDSVGFLPLDFYSPVERFLNAVNPDKVVFIETEIWFNLISRIKKRNVPICLANGRLTEKSYRGYKKFGNLITGALNCYNRFMVQTETDKRRFAELGAHDDRIIVTGNLKIDAPPIIVSAERQKELKKLLPFHEGTKTIIFGSIRNDEFEKMVFVIGKLLETRDAVGVIIAPRYVDKTGELVNFLKDVDKSVRLLSEVESGVANENQTDIFIIDKMGVLKDFYTIADIAVVGGTFDNMGGHNILEPVWAGTPVLYGPSFENVKESADYIRDNNYGNSVRNENELIDRLTGFLEGTVEFRIKEFVGDKISRTEQTVKIIMGNER
jgi:3-deoxy-D-manno-octulosonic-acid transferase